MEFNKPLDVLSFDWDDSKLIEAYEQGSKNRKSLKSKGSKANKEKGKEEKTSKNWQPGNYCRAIYQDDGLLYEATVVDIQGNSCTVEFLGYGDYQEVPLDALEDSLGKKARQKQRKSVKKAELSIYTSDTDYSCVNDSRDVSKAVKLGHPQNSNTTADHCDYYSAGYAQQHPQANFQQHAAPPQITFNHTTHAPAMPPAVQRMGGAAHCLPPPPPPPMPPCSAAANDPSLSAMLISWYMAGYYTGLHQSQKSSPCPTIPKTHCCEHHVPNHCGHFY